MFILSVRMPPSHLLDAVGSRLHDVNLSAASVWLLLAVGSFTSAHLILNKLPHLKLIDHSLNYAKQEDAKPACVQGQSRLCSEV